MPTEDEAGGVDDLGRSVGLEVVPEELADRGAGSRVRLEEHQDLGQVRRRGEQVGIAQHDELSRCDADATIHRSGEPRLPSHLDQPDSGIIRIVCDCSAYILRGVVVHDDDLDVLGRLLEEDRQGLAQQLGVLVGRDQDAHLRAVACPYGPGHRTTFGTFMRGARSRSYDVDRKPCGGSLSGGDDYLLGTPDDRMARSLLTFSTRSH